MSHQAYLLSPHGDNRNYNDCVDMIMNNYVYVEIFISHPQYAYISCIRNPLFYSNCCIPIYIIIYCIYITIYYSRAHTAHLTAEEQLPPRYSSWWVMHSNINLKRSEARQGQRQRTINQIASAGVTLLYFHGCRTSPLPLKSCPITYKQPICTIIYTYVHSQPY